MNQRITIINEGESTLKFHEKGKDSWFTLEPNDTIECVQVRIVDESEMFLNLHVTSKLGKTYVAEIPHVLDISINLTA